MNRLVLSDAVAVFAEGGQRGRRREREREPRRQKNAMKPKILEPIPRENDELKQATGNARRDSTPASERADALPTLAGLSPADEMSCAAF